MRFAKLICSLLLVLGTLTLPAQSHAQVAVGVSVRIGPPLLPVYEQPLCPGEGYIWIPGYWAYADDDYYWVPGTWVLPPEEGLLWTPGYWAWQDGAYVWYAGYWGPVVGFYGGIDYGFGYPGAGFYGGYWSGGRYFYNRNVTNLNVNIVHNTYNTTVVHNTTVNRVSFNGGSGGTTARPTPAEINASRQHRVAMTSEQVQHQHTAATNRNLFASVNHGRPDVVATSRPSDFSNRGAAPTLRNENSNRPSENRKDARSDTNRPENRPSNARPNDNRPPNADRVNPAVMEKHQREQEKLRQQQDSERQRMQQKQAQEQQKLEKRNADAQRKQDLQQRHQQQAQQLQQRHDQQAQKLQQRQDKEVQRQQSKPPKPEHPPHNQQ